MLAPRADRGIFPTAMEDGRFVITGALAPGAFPSEGDGLFRMLDALARVMPRNEAEAAWVFPVVRRDGREYGAAVVSRMGEGERRRVYRARWYVQVKGQDRGRWSVEIEETAEAPKEALARVLDGVRRRADEAGDAEPLDLSAWKAQGGDGDRVA